MLVCGGSGFIGSHLCRRLRKSGHYVIAADWRLNGYSLKQTKTDALTAETEVETEAETDSAQESVYTFCDEFHHVDLRVSHVCDQLMKDARPVWVFHLAADMGGKSF